MALIKCPECGHDVSTLAHSCPNCGYPISEDQKQTIVCNGKRVDVDEVIKIIKEKGEIFALRHIRETTGASIDDADIAVEKIVKSSGAKYCPSSQLPRCPTCGSTDITRQGIVGRAVTSALIGGFAPESRAQFRCNKCGYMW